MQRLLGWYRWLTGWREIDGVTVTYQGQPRPGNDAIHAGRVFKNIYNARRILLLTRVDVNDLHWPKVQVATQLGAYCWTDLTIVYCRVKPRHTVLELRGSLATFAAPNPGSLPDHIEQKLEKLKQVSA